MSTIRLALIGFGAVGQGFVSLLRESAANLQTEHGFRAEIVGVATNRRGSVFCQTGLDPLRLLEAVQKEHLAYYPETAGLQRGLSAMEIIRKPAVDVIIEVSPTNLQTGEPAIEHIKAAFEHGKHVIIANKGPVALAYKQLKELAAAKNRFFGYEGTVMGGTPALQLAQLALAGAGIYEARGILNGTTNYILTQMEHGRSYADALQEAQRLGYAEADPSGDVEGFDAAGKLIILANVLFGVALRLEDVDRTGITKLTVADIESAKAAGERWKLIAQARRVDGGVKASVRPERLPIADPLAGVSGVMNAVTYRTEALGPITVVGAGAGGRETGFAILSDLLTLHRRGI